ncbi:hypothetical protein CLAIMM_07412 [Cladophialophora immunda]|nr:hypothetical protein CLAIMM_07412 [Cladophialophora immunda]
MDSKLRVLQVPAVVRASPTDLIVTLAIALPVLLGTYLVVSEIRRRSARLPIKGPTGLPIVGNLLQVYPDPPEQLRKWGKEYGGVYQIMFGNMPIVVFTSMQAAKDVFVGQGGALLDRPRFYTFHSVLSSVASTIGTTTWSESTKRRRKAAASAMNRTAVVSYTPLIEETSRDWISELLNQGKSGQVAINPKPLILHTILDLTMTVNYGSRLPKEAGLFEEILYVEEQVSGFRSVVGAMQDYVPLLRWNPINLKSAHAKNTNARRLAYLYRFSEEHKQQMKLGTDKPCIQGNVLRDPDHKFTEVELMSINMSMVSGGIDTLANTLTWTIGTLARRPDIQETAYQAIRDVYEAENWGDVQEEKVQYLSALVKESLRFFSVLRLSLPRNAIRDIEYKGIFIPQGTTVFLNAWGCNRDESFFGPDVNEYRPERWFEDENTRLDHAAFGMGTRMCAGNQLASRQLYTMLLRLIWAFKIELSRDPSDNNWGIDPLRDSTEPDAFAARPPEYKVRFVPRNRPALDKMLTV